ncbi:MAG: hypothetical protein IJX97_03345 [Clostridia bacterium]|nr:hypothetical protein [Clostridia bacterium]
MWYEWLIFGAVFLLIPIAVANLKLIAEKKINPTEDQKKNASLLCGFLILFYWLCDLFYMAFILDNLALKFIFGGLVMVIIFYNLSKAFVSGAPTFKWGLIQDFVVGVIMSIYLVYIIPSSDLKEVVIPIVSAVYGGLITLVGVVLTIRETRKDIAKKDDFEAKPFFGIIDVQHYLNDESCKNEIGFRPKKFDGKLVFLDEINIQNSDKAPFYIDKFSVDDTDYYPDSTFLVTKEMVFNATIYVEQSKKKPLDKVYMHVTDVNFKSRIYELQCGGYHDYRIKEVTKED